MAMKNFLYSYAENLRCFTGLASMMQRYEIFMNYARKNTIIFQKNADSEVLQFCTFADLTSAFLKSKGTLLYNLYILQYI